jgi:uncharacterized protein YndB with AHSA1/START domain
VDIRFSITIDRPVVDVFAYLADSTNAPEWLPAARKREKITEGPIGVGTTFAGTDRFPGRDVDWTLEIIEFEPDRYVRFEMSEPFNGRYDIRCEPDGDGTLVSVAVTGSMSGVWRLFDILPNAVVRRGFERDYRRLKVLLESR